MFIYEWECAQLFQRFLLKVMVTFQTSIFSLVHTLRDINLGWLKLTTTGLQSSLQQRHSRLSQTRCSSDDTVDIITAHLSVKCLFLCKNMHRSDCAHLSECELMRTGLCACVCISASASKKCWYSSTDWCSQTRITYHPGRGWAHTPGSQTSPQLTGS